MATEQPKNWITVQKETFTNWTNDHLKDTGRHVEDLQTDLDDGVTLIKLLEALAPEKKMPGRYYNRPRIPIHKLQNLAIAFRFMTDMEGIEFVNIGPGDLTEHNLKLVLGLIWKLILHYKLHSAPSTTTSSKADTKEPLQVKTSTRKILLEWIGSILEGSHITNFTTDWNDGIHLSALIDYCQPGLIPNHASLSKDKALQNIVHAMKLTEKHFGIPQVMRPEDLAVDKPDELSVMTYISYFCCSGSPGEKALLLWVQRQVITANLTITNLTTDWTDGRVLGAVVNAVSGGGFPEYEQMGPEYGLGNCRKSIDAAEQLLGVKKTIEPEEFSSSRLDQLRRMAYLTQFCRAMHAQAHGSRLTDIVIDAAAHKVEVGQLQYPEETGMGRVVCVDLDCSQAGSGVVKAEVMGNTCGRLDPRVDTIGQDMYRVIFEPLKRDLYVLSIYYGKNQVNGSPFSINLNLPEADKVQHLGTSLPKDSKGLVALDFDTKDAGKGKLMVQASGESAGSVPIKIETKADGTYTVSFRPQLPDIYKVDIQWGKFSAYAAGSAVGPVPTDVDEEPVNWGGKPVPGSPFIVNLLPQAQPEKVFCSLPIYTGVGGAIHLPNDVSSAGVGKQVFVKEPLHFTIDAKLAGSGELVIKPIGPHRKDHSELNITDNNDSTYSVEYTPSTAGQHTLNITWAGKEVPRSPFHISAFEPSPDKVECGKAIVVGPNQPVDMLIDTGKAGKGTITAQCSGEECGSIPVNITSTSPTTHKVSFLPEAEDFYKLSVFFDESEVKGSPFEFDLHKVSVIEEQVVTQMPISKVTILDHIPTHLQVNHEVSFRVDTTSASQGELTVTANVPSTDLEPRELEMNPSKEDPQIYEVSYTPTVAGVHKLHIKWDGESIPASPVRIIVSDIITFPRGKPVVLDINSDCKTGDLESYAIHQESGTQHKVKISRKEKGKLITLEPKEYGLYSIHVLIRQREITGSPLVVRYDKAAQPEKCTVLEMPISGYVKKVVAFKVDTREAGSGVLNVKATGPAGSKKAKVKVKSRKDGTYTVEYTPTAAGDHSFIITWGGVSIPGSPFPISIQEEAKLETVECRIPIEVQPPLIIDAFVEGEEVGGRPEEPREITLTVGTPLRVLVKTKDKKGTLTSAAHGDSCGLTEVQVSQPKRNTFEAFLNPSTPDRYILELKLNGENLPRTPFIVHYILPPTDASKCRILELENIPAQPQPNHEIRFKVDCNGAGPGVLKILSSSPSTSEPGKLEAKPTKKDPHVFDISYTPPVPGLHILDLLWSDETIPGSPLRFPVEQTLLETMQELLESLPEVVETEQPSIIEVGQGVDMGIRTDKGGTITATCIGVEYGSVPVKITSTSATSHKLSFIPVFADLYNLSVFFNNSEVKGSPFYFDLRATKKEPIIEQPVLQTRKEVVENVPQGMNVRMVEKPPRVVDVNKEISLTVDASEAGEGSLKVTAERPSVDQQPATIEVVRSEEEPRLHHFNYIPTFSGNHLLTLKWEGKEIPNSPVSLVAIDLATAHKIHYGNPASVDFETEHKERDLKAFAIYEGSKAGTHQKVKIHRVQKNRYNLSFHPKQPGLYYIHVLDRDKDIPGSPFVVKYGKPPMPDAVKAEILSGTGYVGEVSRLIIDAKEAGSGEVNIHAVGIRGKETGSLAVEDRKDGTYSVEYTPSIPGKQQFLITWAGKEVPGSPFPFTVRDRAAEVLVSEVYLVDRVGDLQLVEFHSVEAGAISEITATTDRAILVKVKAQTEQQKKGDITASVRGDRVGHAVVQTSRKSASTFEVTFKPPEADRYTAEVKVGDEVVPATPFVVNYTSPPAKGSMCQIVHLETLNTLVQVSREVALRVDARRAGDGSLEASLEGPEEEEDTPEVEVKEEEPYVFRVSFTPREAGTHGLKLKWGEEAVPGEPLNFNVQGIQVFPHGKLVGFEREVDSKISDLEVYAIHEGSGTRLKIKVSRLRKGRYKLTLEPKDPGMYAIHMLSRKKELPGSPLYVRYDKPPNPEACKVQWLKQKAWVREVTQFSIDTREAGTGKLNMSVTAPTREEHPNFHISDNKDGTFTATYIPDAAGEHFFNIIWDGRALPGSPFCMTVLDPPVVEEPKEVDFSEEAEVEDGAPPEEFNIPIGQALCVRVTPGDRKQRRAKFIATVMGEKTGSSDVAISRTASGFQAYFNPMLPDRYTIELKLRDKQVPRSPFIANYFMPATNTSKCKLLGTDSIQNMQLVNETVHLKVDSREAGPGTLQINADGPSKDEVKISKQQSRIYNVSYTPTAPGIHTLSFTFENHAIPNSPVSLAVGDPKKVSIAESPTGVSLKTGEPITITFNTSKAGCGDFTASCKGKKSGEISARVTKKSPDRYSVVFTPTEVDVYRLSVLWGGHQIRGSPFNLTPVDVDKVKTVGPAMPRGVAGPREMILDTAQAGKGSVTASCINKRGQDVPVSVSETSSNIYKVSFQPPRPDIYTLSVQYGGQDINGSPFHINTLPPDANRVKVTQPEKMELCSLLVYRCNCVDAGSGKLTVSCQGVRYGPVSVDTKEVDTAQYELSFTPDKEDLYRLSIQWEGEDVPGSPFSANFLPPAQPDKVECGEAVSAGTDQAVDMLIDISKAGGGTLTAQCSGEECGSIPVNITSTSPTTHKVSFIPKAEDFYKLSVFFDESEVKGSPFEFDMRKVTAIEEQVVTQMPISKVTIFDHISTHLQVNHEVSFQVDTTTAGQGELTVTANVPSTDIEPPELEMNPSKEDPQIYEVSYTPTVAGVHKLHIKWDGESIPASPVSIVVSDIITFPHGKPVVLDINADCKTGDLDSYAIHQESGTQHKVKISRKEKGKFKLTLEPKEYGLYSIHVLIRQREITGSPFVVRYNKAAQPEKCTVLEMPISGYVKKVMAFKVDTREAGSGVLNVKATGPAGSRKAKLKVKSRKDGTYTVEYTPTAAGDHSFIITWGGIAIPGSPFPISIQDEAKLETVEYRIPIEVQPPLVIDAFEEGEVVVGQPEEPREITLTVGTPLRVLVKTKDKKGTLTSAAHGDSCGLTEVQVSQPKRNTFEAFLNPSTPDRYILELKLNGENLPRTPFIVHYILPPTDASKCRILELENIPAQPQPNHEIHFKVDCNGAGPGVLKILSSSPSTSEPGKLEAKPTKKDPHVFDISYTPPVPGLHILDLLWSDETIPGSPLRFPVEQTLLETMQELLESLPGVVETEQPSIIEVGHGVDMGIRTDKGGAITATCIGVEYGSVPVKITSTSATSHKVSFIPVIADLYNLSVFFKNSEVKGSPFCFDLRATKREPIIEEPVLQTRKEEVENVPQGMNVRLVEKPPRVVDVNKEISLTVDASEAGEGSLKVTAERPSVDQQPATIEVVRSEEEPRLHHFNYIPTSSGNHLLTLKWEGKEIPDSPVSLVALDLATAHMIHYGNPASVDFETEHEERDLKAFAIYEGSKAGTHQKVKIHRVQKNRYNLSFHPKQPGLYYIHVLDQDKDIPGSPFVVKYGKPPMPDAVKAEILSDTGYVGEVTRFIIDAKEAGSGEVNIHAVGIRGKETGSLAVEDRKDGTYSVEYTPSVPGKQQFLITWAGKEVPGSPFPFTVRDRATEVLVSEVYLVDRVGDLQLVEFPSVEAGAISEIAATTDRAILVKVKAQTEQQKKGDIIASVRGDRVGHVVVQTSRKSASTFEVTFKPPEADRYTTEVKVGDEVVPATPFVVNYTSPPAKGSMCQIVHLETLSTLVQVGREVALRVDARRAGDGSLEASLEGPEEEEDTPEVEVNEEEPYVFRVRFTPREAGTHGLKLKWGEEAVPGAPLNFNVQGIQVFPHGKLVGFEREVDSKISDLEAYAIHEGSGTRLKINVSHLRKGRYKLTLEPKDPGMYAIHMLSRKKELPGSPLYVQYDKPPNPEACKVQWLKQKAWVREVTQFSVDTREAGTGKLNMSVTAPTREEHPNFQISDNKDGTFTATYIPDADGEHFFNIAWDGRALPGSPFCMTVLDPPVVEEPKEVDFSEEAEVEDGAQPEEFNIPIGQALRVRVTPSDRKQRRAKFIATVTGEKTGSSDVAISRTASGFQAYFNPMLPDRYTIELKLRDKQVPRSPFIANYFMPATNASKCKLLGTDSIQNMQLVNETVHLKVDSREAGPGTLQVNADGPSKDEVKISKQQPRIYNVSYTPTAPGIHTLNFTFENQPIPNSPVSLAVGDPKKVSIAESPTVSLKTGEPISITFDTSKAGCGDFTASCKGKKSGEISATVTKKSPDRYSVVFTPTEVDVYRLSVLWGGHQIRGSPFNLTPVDVDKVKTLGPAMPRGVAGPREMILDTAQAGKGSVTASCINKRGQDVPVSVSETSSNIYKVSFQPPRPDIYTLSVQYGGQDINGSPFHINTLPPDANRVKVTQPEKMELYSLLVYRCNCVDAGSGKLTVSCQGVRYGPVSVDTKEVDTAQYELSFTPDKEDLYRLSIQWEGEDVPGSPFSANFLPPAQPDKVECGEAVSAGTNQPVDMLIDISKAGGGTLTAQCSGEECGSIPVNITSTSPTTHKVSFIPKAEDFYKLSVFFDESEVKGSPFEFDLRKVTAIEQQVVTQMPISKVTILDHIPNHLQVNHEVSFRVDTTTAGQGELTVTADVPSTDLEPPELEMTPSEEDPQIYEVSYTPTVAGVHKLHIKWDGESIPASPVSIAVSDIITFPHGKPVVLDINADCKTGDLDSYAIHQESGTQHKVKISRKEKGKFKLTLEPKEYGLYSIHVLIRQREIAGSPFVVRYDKAAQPEKCTVLEMPISGYVKKVVAFKVDTREAGSGVLNVKATGPAGSKKAKLKVKSRKDSTYTVEYTPTAAGDHSFIITWGGIAIPGSPFPISIQEEAKLETVECRIPIEVQPPLVINAFVEGEEVVGQPEEPREITLTVGTPLRVLVKTKDKKGTLTSAAHGDSCGLTEVQVSQPKRNTFEAFLNPSTPDRYILELKLNGENLPRTPFIVHYILPPTDASKCRILELENIPAQPQPNHEIRFKVDCNGAGPGVLKILSSSPPTSKESSKLEAKLAREDHSCIVDISYTPSVPGLHILDLLWSEEIIPGSPLHFSVVIQKEEILLERKIRGSFQATTARSGVSILKEFRRTQTFGRSVQFHLSTIHTGPGTLRLSSTGPGKAEVKVVDNKDGVYSCEFNPTVPGKYHLNILWNEEHIKGSPYLLNFLSKHKLLAITGLQLEHVDFRIGVPYTFQLDCEGVGEGAPTITCRPQNAAKINLTPVEGTQNHYRCEIVPREPGNHEISVQYKHMHIMGSPFNVYFDPSSDASKCQVIQSSVKSEEAGIDKVTLCVSTERAGEGELLASVKDVTTKEPLPITVSRSSENEKHYMLEFSIKQGMEYLVSVTYDQQHIHQSPFKLSLAGPKGAACCHAEGKGLNSMQVGKWSQFIVSTADAGPGELSVKIEKEGEELEPSKLVSSLSDNQYEVKYLPTSCGMYTITVLWAKQHIPGSPFKARCYSPGHAHLLSISEPITTEIYVAEPLQFIVNAEAVTKEGELAVTLRSQTKTIPGQDVIKGEDGNYTCAVCPPEPGKYAVHVHWNGEDIQGSPFNVKVTIPPKPENVRASGPGLSNGYIGQEGNFMIETGGGPGVLAVDVQGPKGAFKIYMRRHPDNDRTVLVRYNPIDVGPYVIDIMWSGVHIPGSPFKVNITEQRTPKEDLRQQRSPSLSSYYDDNKIDFVD